jgi:hypothetical protein
MVETVAFSDILDAHGSPHYLKIDIEGKDHLCLEALQNRTKPKYISVEAVNLSLLETIHNLGYTKYKLVCQNYFKGGSGPFGEFANDDSSGFLWNSYDEVVKNWKKRRNNCWWDFHASL